MVAAALGLAPDRLVVAQTLDREAAVTAPRRKRAHETVHPPTPDRDATAAELAAGDPIAELFELVERAGGTVRLHGRPISAQQLRGVAERHAHDRLLAAIAPRLAPGPHVEEHW